MSANDSCASLQRQELQTQAEQEKADLMDLGRRLGQMEAASFFQIFVMAFYFLLLKT
ncbi:hypothetical protein [Comamonas aquatica]|uniref:hypothetical protein n=1 Tax=Comamonas aquatica TaxID=225991 RepID=UPI000A51A6C9|nr:hypothetical protein [Comamonas aquatica]